MWSMAGAISVSLTIEFGGPSPELLARVWCPCVPSRSYTRHRKDYPLLPAETRPFQPVPTISRADLAACCFLVPYDFSRSSSRSGPHQLCVHHGLCWQRSALIGFLPRLDSNCCCFHVRKQCEVASKRTFCVVANKADRWHHECPAQRNGR